MSQTSPAILVLADGTVFRGTAIGASGSSVGEVVFNTSITGYQEILTDPSYCKQIVTLTYPHIGNVGCNPEDVESRQVFASGLIIRDLSMTVSNFRSTQSLPEYLKANNVVAIAGIDTRKLTRILRSKGAQNGCIATGDNVEAALAAARGFAGLAGMDLAQGGDLRQALRVETARVGVGRGLSRRHRIEIPCGGVRLWREAQHPAHAGRARLPHHRGAGQDQRRRGAGDEAGRRVPVQRPRRSRAMRLRDRRRRRNSSKLAFRLYGICLGHQIMGLACGAKTVKMKFGHRGANHPVQDTQTKRVMITSQNHGFAVDAATLPKNARVTHISLFDGTLQGFELTDKPAFCFQGHPEASPGPHDVDVLFDRFVAMMGK